MPGLAAFLGVERFLKEIEIAARLTHPHVMALGGLHVHGAMIALVVPLWLATTFVTARTVYSRMSRRRERVLEGLADRLAATVRDIVADQRPALRRPSP